MLTPRRVNPPNFDPFPKRSRFPWRQPTLPNPYPPYQPNEGAGGPTETAGDVRNGPPPAQHCDRPPIFPIARGRGKSIVLKLPPFFAPKKND